MKVKQLISFTLTSSTLPTEDITRDSICMNDTKMMNKKNNFNSSGGRWYRGWLLWWWLTRMMRWSALLMSIWILMTKRKRRQSDVMPKEEEKASTLVLHRSTSYSSSGDVVVVENEEEIEQCSVNEHKVMWCRTKWCGDWRERKGDTHLPFFLLWQNRTFLPPLCSRQPSHHAMQHCIASSSFLPTTTSLDKEDEV